MQPLPTSCSNLQPVADKLLDRPQEVESVYGSGSKRRGSLYVEGPFIANTHVLCWHEIQGKQGFFTKPV
jgi:hypothetical protein